MSSGGSSSSFAPPLNFSLPIWSSMSVISLSAKLLPLVKEEVELEEEDEEEALCTEFNSPVVETPRKNQNHAFS